MSTRGRHGAIEGAGWEAVAITVSRIEGMHGQAAWRCKHCGLVLGGRPVRRPLDHCPICAAEAGLSVAVLVRAGKEPPIETLVVDEHFHQLVDAYRAAKSATAHDEEDHAALSNRGNYDLDGEAATTASEGVRSEEHRAALALADAALARSH